MNRKYVAYAIIAILIAIFVGLHLSGAPAEAGWVRCHMNLAIPPCDRDGGWVRSTDYFKHRVKCRAGHTYWICYAPMRSAHAACRAPAPTPAPTPAPAPAPTPAPAPAPVQSSQAQSPSSPSPPSQNPPASPPQSSCTAPTVHFKTWTVGGPYDPGSAKKTRAVPKDTSFITTTETTCKVYAEVTYNGSQDPNTCELTGVSFNIKMSHSFAVSGTPTVTPSGSGFSKVWTYEATLTGPNSSRRSGPRCDHNNRGPGRPRKIDYPARNQTLMWMTLDFTGTYDGGTVTAPTVTLNQNTRDGIRQEYVDFDLNVVPDRSHFKSGPDSIYNWGHYNYTMDEGLAAMRSRWAAFCDGTPPATDMKVKSGYRHPYHNHRCVRNVSVSKTKNWHGLHQYGSALDIGGKLPADNKPESLVPDANGDGKRTAADRDELMEAAEAAGARYWWKYTSGHVHADWGPSNWIPAKGSRLGPPRELTELPDSGGSGGGGGGGSDDSGDSGGGDSGDSGDSGGGGDSAPAAPAAPTTPATPKTTPTTPAAPSNLVRCGHGRNGNACSRGGWASSREAHKVTCPAGHRYYACSSGGARFHANCRARRSGEVRCARGSMCRSGGWASSRNAHQTTCGRGHTYWSGWPRSVSYHRGH